jgi:hypothetical protein
MTGDTPDLRRAVHHEPRARNYRRQSELLLERDGDLDSAGALAYEAAKQCINAVANQRGNNPGPTAAKLNALREISETEPAGAALMRNWRAATLLHIHADRGHLTYQEFVEAWVQTQAFVDAMLTIYQRDA